MIVPRDHPLALVVIASFPADPLWMKIAIRYSLSFASGAKQSRGDSAPPVEIALSPPAPSKKQAGFATASNIARFPGRSRGLPPGRHELRQYGSGFRGCQEIRPKGK